MALYKVKPSENSAEITVAKKHWRDQNCKKKHLRDQNCKKHCRDHSCKKTFARSKLQKNIGEITVAKTFTSKVKLLEGKLST